MGPPDASLALRNSDGRNEFISTMGGSNKEADFSSIFEDISKVGIFLINWLNRFIVKGSSKT